MRGAAAAVPPSPASSAAAAAVAAAVARAPGGEELWRTRASRGSVVEVFSTNANGWVPAKIVGVSRHRLRLEYVVHGIINDKVLLRGSRHVRSTTRIARDAPAWGQAWATAEAPTPQRRSENPLRPGPRPLSPREAPRHGAGGRAASEKPAHRVAGRCHGQAEDQRLSRELSSAFADSAFASAETQTLCPELIVRLEARAAGGADKPCRPQSEQRPKRPSLPAETELPQLPAPPVPPPPSRPKGETLLQIHPGEWIRAEDLQLGALLGSGGFGSVYEGRLHDQDVAIKRFHMETGQLTAVQIADFQKEVANLQALRHPSLISFIGVALEPPLVCIITELARGGSLHAALHVSKTPSSSPGKGSGAAGGNGARRLGCVQERRAIVLQILEGVAFLHNRNPPTVHRDLKSQNVVLDEHNNAKLCDFGLTESMEKTHLSRRPAGEGGSPRYMAPELFDAGARLTEKIDIWSFGCLAIEVLVRRMPHEECKSIQQVATKLLVQKLAPFPDSWGGGFRPEVQHSISQCFTFAEGGRPSAAQLQEALSRFESFAALRLSGRPPSTPPAPCC